jgi:hypothetical protein
MMEIDVSNSRHYDSRHEMEIDLFPPGVIMEIDLFPGRDDVRGRTDRGFNHESE